MSVFPVITRRMRRTSILMILNALFTKTIKRITKIVNISIRTIYGRFVIFMHFLHNCIIVLFGIIIKEKSCKFLSSFKV